MNPASRTRIVVLAPALDAVSGVSTHVNMLLGSAVTRRHELLHFRVGSEGRRESALQKAARFLLSPLQLASLLRRSGAGVVHLNTSLDQKAYWRDFAYLLVAKALRRRVINQIHGGVYPQDMFGGGVLLTALLRRFLVASDLVAVLSTGELAAYRAFDARINVRLVPNAIDARALLEVPRAYNRTEPLRFVYVGRLIAAKGLFQVIDALGRLRAAGRRFRLQIAGTGQDEAGLRAAVDSTGLKDCVSFLGGVFGERKERLWLDSDVFLFPSYHPEGLPYALLESMAAGCVPIASPVAAIPDVMQDGVHGLLVPARDPDALAAAIIRLDDDRDQLVEMAERARRRIRDHYTLERLAADFDAIYADRPAPGSSVAPDLT